MQVINN